MSFDDPVCKCGNFCDPDNVGRCRDLPAMRGLDFTRPDPSSFGPSDNPNGDVPK